MDTDLFCTSVGAILKCIINNDGSINLQGAGKLGECWDKFSSIKGKFSGMLAGFKSGPPIGDQFINLLKKCICD